MALQDGFKVLGLNLIASGSGYDAGGEGDDLVLRMRAPGSHSIGVGDGFTGTYSCEDPGGPITEANTDSFENAFRMHLVNNQILVQKVVENMKEEGYGRIVNIISTSVKAPIPGLGVSNTIRAAVANWAKTLSIELGPYGITVNNVLPGFTNTNRLKSIISNKAKKQGKSQEEIEEIMKNSVPAKRFGEANEIANAIAFLCTPAASYINGVNIPVDGGRTQSL